MRVKWIPFIALSLMALAFSSCASLHQKLAFKAIPQDLPVSASSSILVGDKVVQSDGFASSTPFSITKDVSVPLNLPKAEVDLYPDLKEAAAKSGGDAIAGLKISIQNFQSSDYGWVCFERYMGAYIAVIGGAMVAFTAEFGPSSYGGPNVTYDATSYNRVLGAGWVVTGVGVALFGGSFLHERLGHSVYTIGLEGQSVKLTKDLK